MQEITDAAMRICETVEAVSRQQTSKVRAICLCVFGCVVALCVAVVMR